MEKTSYKQYTREEIQGTSDIMLLYQLLLFPVANMKRDIESSERKNDAVAAVYGATAIPIKKRMNALNNLSKFVNLNNGIILSGGRSWTSIVPKSDKFRGDNKIISEYMNGQGKKLIQNRARTFMRGFPEIKEIIRNKEKERWEELLKEEYGDKDKSKLKSYEEMYDAHINEKINEIMKSKERMKIFYGIYKDEINTNTNEANRVNDVARKYEKLNNEFEEWYNMYQNDKKSARDFLDWLYIYFDNKYIENIIIHSITEVDLMKIELQKISNQKESPIIIEDRKATNSLENAENTVEAFEELRKNNPDLKKLIVVSDWQYLLRQVLTTQKVAQDRGLDDIEITGYPADSRDVKHKGKNVALKFEDIEEYKKTMKTDLIKIVLYDNVGDCNITAYVEKNKIENEGPIVLIGDQTLQEYIESEKENEHITNKIDEER